MRVLIFILLLSLSWGKIVWPPPPEKARIAYEKAIETPEDVGIKKSIWQRLKSFFLGEKREYRILKPAGVYADKDLLIVADQGLSGVLIFNLKEKKVYFADGFPSPIDVDFDGNRIFVSDSVLGSIVLLDKKGKRIGTLGKKELERPTGIVIDKKRGRLYVSDTLKNKILIFTLKGKKLGEMGKGLNRPTYINLDSAGNIYVSDSLNAKVRIFSPEGEEIFSFGKRGTTIGTFANPRGIAVDREGHIYVGDTLFSTIQIFNREGKLLLVIGSFGKGEGEFAVPMDIFIRDDRIFVADSYNARVVVLRYLGGK